MIRKQVAYWKSLSTVELYMVLLFMSSSAIKTLVWLLGGV
jgi:hypothetical protein